MANPNEHQEIKTPKVFVSYAQSDERTHGSVKTSERLTHDGVEVVADLYELPLYVLLRLGGSADWMLRSEKVLRRTAEWIGREGWFRHLRCE